MLKTLIPPLPRASQGKRAQATQLVGWVERSKAHHRARRGERFVMGFAIVSSSCVLNKLALQTWHKAASGCKGLFRLVANRVGRAGAWWHIPKMHPQRPPEVPRPNADAIDTRHMRSASYVGAGIWKRCQMFTANCGEWRTSDLVAAPGRANMTVFLLCGSTSCLPVAGFCPYAG